MPGTGTALEVHVRGVDKVNELKKLAITSLFEENPSCLG